MNKQDTLQRAIELALAGGWDCREYIDWNAAWTLPVNQVGQVMAEVLEYDHKQEEYLKTVNERKAMTLIFNHDFAKALWGELDMHDDEDEIERLGLQEVEYYYNSGNGANKVWEARLQQMVIADDPLQYLADNLPEEGEA